MNSQLILALLLSLMLHNLSHSLNILRIRHKNQTKNKENSTHRTPAKTLNHVDSGKEMIFNGITGKITNIDWRTKVSQAHWPLEAWLSDHPTNKIKCRIFCRSGYHLQMRHNGAVSGTLNQKSKNTLFELQSFGPSILRIKSVATGYYLIMKRNGCIKGSKQNKSMESLFRESHEENAFSSYASEKYFYKKRHDMLIGIKHNGKIKRATKSHRHQQATQFLIIRL